MTSGQPRVRLGIVGAGIMGERMLRAAFDHAPDIVDVAAVWDTATAAMARIAAALPGTPCVGTIEQLIEAADCIYVATPPATHIAYADQALAAGRAVFLEKPLATDVPAAEAFVHRADGARVAVNFPFASSLAVERLRTWLDEGVIGPTPTSLDIAVAFATWPRPWQQAAAAWLDAPAEGGFTREVVSHFLFLARRILGPLHLEAASIDRPPGRTERCIEATLRAGATPVRLHGAVGTTPDDDRNSWTLHGTGAIRLRDWSWAERRQPDGTWLPDPEAAPNERMRPLVLRRQLEQVVHLTAGRPHRLATLPEALEVQAVVEAILGSHAHL